MVLFILISVISGLAAKDQPEVKEKSVLVLDLSKQFDERKQASPIEAISGEGAIPGLFDVIRLIKKAKEDENISGIYLEANNAGNGFASSNEIRNALIDFKSSRKFIIAYGDVMSQDAYFIANAADKIYVNPSGAFDWSGFSVTLPFFKGAFRKA